MRIFIEFDLDLATYVIMCDDGRMSPAPAGQRLFRARPHPDIKFSHPTIEQAENDARLLRNYLSALAPRKISKKEQREYIA